MNEHRLEELKELSLSALSHRPLVELARHNTPTETHRRATERWPSRQAKAARSLAILRRDYGEEAFNGFLAEMEHARTDRSVTEQAQEERKMTSRILSSLERISDPHKKLEIMVEHGLIGEASAYLSELAKTMTAYFWWSRGPEKNSRELFTTETDPSSPISGVKIGFHSAETDVANDRLNILHGSVFSLDLRGAITTLKWDEQQTLSFVEGLLERVLAHPIYTHHFVWTIYGIERVVRHFFPSDSDIALRTERYMLLRHFRNGRLFELRDQVLPNPPERQRAMHNLSELDKLRACKNELDPIVDRMLELGMSKGGIREEFLAWIRQHTENCRPEFMLAAAGAKCFEYEDKERDTAVHCYLPYISILNIDVLQAFSRLGLWTSGDREYFIEQLTSLLTEGRAGNAFRVLTKIGESLGVFPKHISGKGDSSERARKMMDVLSHNAFSTAMKAERFGIAAAIAQHFSCFDEAQVRNEVNLTFIQDIANMPLEPSLESLRHYGPTDLNDIINDKDYTGGIVREDYDSDEAFEEAHSHAVQRDQMMSETRAERDAKLEELKAIRKTQIEEATQLAIDLKQPIRLEWMDAIY